MKHRRRSLIQFCLSLLLFSLCASPLGANVTAPATPTPFPLPAGLEPAVEFWKRIFSEYSISQVVYFDPLDLSKIYEVADIGPAEPIPALKDAPWTRAARVGCAFAAAAATLIALTWLARREAAAGG